MQAPSWPREDRSGFTFGTGTACPEPGPVTTVGSRRPSWSRMALAPAPVAPRPPRTGARQIEAAGYRHRPALLTKGNEADQFVPVRMIGDVDRKGDAGCKHLRRMPPVARNEQQLSWFEDKRDRLRLSHQRKPRKIRVFRVVDERKVWLLFRPIQEGFLIWSEHDELLSTEDLHQECMRADSVVMEHGKRSTLSPDVQLDRCTAVQYLSNPSDHVTLRQPVWLEIRRQRLYIFLE